jgi:hypothetical protein
MTARDRAAVVVPGVLTIIVTALREHPEFHRHARADLLRVLEPARPELAAFLREEFREERWEALQHIDEVAAEKPEV